jgi:hypothetical protein
MCPDRQLISLYFDGELPTPWKEKLQAHLESCVECRTVLSGFKDMKERFQELPQESVQAAAERVWEKITALEEKPIRLRTEKNLYSFTWRHGSEKKIWGRTVSLPIPAAAAAVFALVILFAIVGIRRANQPQLPDTVAAYGMGLDDQGILPIQDMTDLLQYLSSQDGGDFMVIRLPESRNFYRSGEPALINAADYSRRSSSR